MDVVTEAHGSIQVLRHVTELGDRMDFVASADEQLIPPLMYDRDDPETGAPWADWYCAFATNRMVLAVSPKSPLAGELTSATWYRRLAGDDVRFGLADPRFDAAGYRALMVLQLAERDSTTTRTCSRTCSWAASPRPSPWSAGDGVDVIEVPEILETSPAPTSCCAAPASSSSPCSSPATWTAPSSTRAWPGSTGSSTCELPAAIDLGDADRRDDYATVCVKLDFQRFASVRPEFTGDVIRYAFTIPANAPDPGWRGSSSPSCSGRREGASLGRPPAAAHAARSSTTRRPRRRR